MTLDTITFLYNRVSRIDPLCGHPLIWSVSNPAHQTLLCRQLPPTQTPSPTRFSSYMNALLTPMFCTPSWAIHPFCPTQVPMPCIRPPHLILVGSNTPSWAISPLCGHPLL